MILRSDGDITTVDDLGPAAEGVGSQRNIVTTAIHACKLFNPTIVVCIFWNVLEIEATGALSDTAGSETGTRTVRSTSVERCTCIL